MEVKEDRIQTQILLYLPAFINSFPTLSTLRWKPTWLSRSVQLLLPFHFFATILLDFARSKTNLASSYRKTKILIPFYCFARRHAKEIQQFCMFEGRNPSFCTDVHLLSFGRAAAIQVLWFCRETQLLWHPKAVSIYNQIVTKQRFVSLQHWCKLLRTA